MIASVAQSAKLSKPLRASSFGQIDSEVSELTGRGLAAPELLRS